MIFKEPYLYVKLIDVAKFKRKNINFKNCRRSFDSISIRISGSGYFDTKESKVALEKGEILYIPKGTIYNQATKGEVIIAVHFILNNNFSSDMEKITLKNPSKIIKMFEVLYEKWRGTSNIKFYECTALFNLILGELHKEAKNCEISVNPISKIQKSIDYINDNYLGSPIPVSFLAKMSNMSCVYYRRIFKKYLKTSPIKYINDLKLEYGAHLLRENMYNINEIAEITGYNDPKYFSLLFKKKFLISPKQFQKKMRNSL